MKVFGFGEGGIGMDRKETKKDNPFYIAFICILLLGPFIAGPILFAMGKNLAGTPSDASYYEACKSI